MTEGQVAWFLSALQNRSGKQEECSTGKEAADRPWSRFQIIMEEGAV